MYLVWLVSSCFVAQLKPVMWAQEADAHYTRSMIEQWIQAEKAESKAKTAWKLERQNLKNHQLLLQSEKDSLEQQLRSLDEKQVSESGERENLERSISELENSKAILKERIEQSENDLNLLLPKLPPLLRKKIESQLPNQSESNQTGSNLVRRLQKLIGGWNELHQFQNEVSIVKQLIPLVDSSEVEAEVLYFGLAQAYFVTPDDQRAGIGKVNSSKWVWTEIPNLGPEIRTALKSMNLPDPRNPVTLPATLNKED